MSGQRCGPRRCGPRRGGPHAHPHQPVEVAGPGAPLTSSEKAILDDVLEMMEEQGVTHMQAYMAQYGVSAMDTFDTQL